ncbi:MAG: hypothetical protein ABGX16_12430 [Pirellulales bacterium]
MASAILDQVDVDDNGQPVIDVQVPMELYQQINFLADIDASS